jgi:hypothetical protein
MVEKPTSGDEEQRRAQTRAARRQSGLPPEIDDGAQDAASEIAPASGGSAPADDGIDRRDAEPAGDR